MQITLPTSLSIVLAVWGTFALGTTKPTATATATKLDAVLTSLQRSWDTTHSYEASFKQIIDSKRMATKDETTGTISVVKPGKLRWNSETDHATQILNSKKFISIRENRRRKSRVVEIYNDISGKIDTKMLNFLAGKTLFKEWYQVTIVSETKENIMLRLSPKKDKKDADGTTYDAEFDKKRYLLRTLINETEEGKVQINFSDIKTNIALDAKLFDYEPLPTDIVHVQ